MVIRRKERSVSRFMMMRLLLWMTWRLWRMRLGLCLGNVTTNDDVGEDEPGYVVKEISFGATHVGVPATGTVTIAGAHGSLTISHTGAYTYTGTSVGNDQFVYKIVDQDGDAATATLKIVVADIDTQPTVENAILSVDETIVDDAGSQTVSGTLTVDFRADGPGTVNPVAGALRLVDRLRAEL